MEWLVGETEILGENMPQCRYFIYIYIYIYIYTRSSPHTKFVNNKNAFQYEPQLLFLTFWLRYAGPTCIPLNFTRSPSECIYRFPVILKITKDYIPKTKLNSMV
jgi:hypothetical protein